MAWRTRFGAVLGATGLLLLAASLVTAAPPTYSINVSKSADPGAVPPSGGDVTYTVWVTATGTGFFNSVFVDDGMAGCTLGAPVKTGGDTDDKLEPGETWAYSCTVTGVTPGTENTATVNACHDQSACTSSHDATGSYSITVDEGEPTQPPPSEPPGSDPPGSDPPGSDPPGSDDPQHSQDQAGATEPTTDAIGPSLTSTPDKTMLLVLALGMLLASLVLVTPARPVRQRR